MGEPTAAPSDFITVSAAKREHGVAPSTLARAALIGSIGYMLPPGRSALYERAGVERLASEARERAKRREERKPATKRRSRAKAG